MSPDLQRQQLTMTGGAGAEDIEDGLAAPRRPPSKHSKSLAHPRRLCRPRQLMCLVLPGITRQRSQ